MNINKRICAGGLAAAAVAVMCGFGVFDKAPKDVPTDSSAASEQKGGSKYTFMEDKTGADDTVSVEQAEKATDEMEELQKNLSNPERSSHTDTFSIDGEPYYLFNHDILLPIPQKEWAEFVIPQSKDGTYDKISEYYPTNESPTKWTQKFTIHKVNGISDDSAAFMEKLVNGILVNLSDRMALQGEAPSKDNTEVNYVRKDSYDALMYWGVKGVEEVQFVRVFRSEFSGDLYVATSSYRLDITSIDEDFAGDKMAVLESIQQLKKKENRDTTN